MADNDKTAKMGLNKADSEDLASPAVSEDAPTLIEIPARHASIERVSQPSNENSPLLSGADGEEHVLVDDEVSLDVRDEDKETKSIWHIILLTISIGGLQMAWAVELSNGSPYLLSLGLSKSLMALVWIAGPLSGTLVQPYVGIRSDNCRISWGKRKPFIIGGAGATIVSLLMLAWTREIVGGFLGLFGAERISQFVKTAIIVFAVIWVYVLDFAINTVQAAIRAFMVDGAPTHQQEATNAMASRMLGTFNIISYGLGYLDLPKYVWFLGNTQFKVLCVIASVALGITVLVSCGLIKERDPNIDGPPPKDRGGVLSFFKSVFNSIKRLPPQTRKVCEVQFFAWIGWFPFLFYVSTWIGDLYVQPFFVANPDMSPDEIEQVYAKATRIGTFALLVWSLMSLTANMVLPLLVAPTYDTPLTSGTSIASQKSYTTRTERILSSLVIPWLSIRRAWSISIVIFGLCMISALFIRTPTIGTIVVGVAGIPWAMTMWAPFAIIAAEISARDAARRSSRASGSILDGSDDSGDQAGVILGIHNMSIASPQVLATLGSSVIFRALQKPRGTPGDFSMGVVFAVGGFFALIAAFIASRLTEGKPVTKDNVPVRIRPQRSFSSSASFGAY